MIRIFGLNYLKAGNSGGWSRNAKHRPQPVVEMIEVESVDQTKRRKFTAFDFSTTPPTLLRMDYGLKELMELGGKLPDFYIDVWGNICEANGKLVMEGPCGTPESNFRKLVEKEIYDPMGNVAAIVKFPK